MKASTLLSRYLSDLQTWAATIQPGCKVILARDPYHALYVLATAPSGFLGVLVDDGDQQQGFREDPLRQMSFSLYLQVSRPLEANPSTALLDGKEGGLPPLLDLCESAADRVATLNHADEDCEDAANHVSRETVTIPTDDGPVPLPAYRLRFTLQYAPAALTARTWEEPEEP